MERIDRAQLSSALTQTGGQLQKCLPSAEYLALGVLLNQTAKRYPHQDVTDSMEEYLIDLERLAVRYSLQSVEDAIAALRIDPEQEFFPRPDEVAAEMRRQRRKKVPSDIYARG
jgi:hypothetical protein